MTNSSTSFHHHGGPSGNNNDTEETDTQRDALFVGSVEKALRVLQAFSGDKSALSLSEISERTGLGKSAAQRFCHTLVSLGYLLRDERSRQLRPSAKLLEFSFTFLASDPLSSIAAPYLLQARELSGEAVNLALPHGFDVIYITRLPSLNSHLVNPPIGGRAPMFCTSSGRAYLSALPEQAAKEIVEQSNLRQITPHTITDKDKILALIAQARLDGFASAVQECINGELTVGAPIFGRQGKVVASMNICVHGRAWSPEEVVDKLAPIAMKTANEISQALATSPNI
ncbi:IclR family transcriptional regulator [uncultured Maritalea sp.]|jgi:IclR family pca regulon transcriptional regulator|uniref:IclR family transcriptional regulator n=1 Tax=uncultured Maritalea sp. TaxID=757249 RepID=UPI00260AE0A4|nr:IclR family transcriptional regulator C-terminal domain-containing protein [uncultured Maritalea sp.]